MIRPVPLVLLALIVFEEAKLSASPGDLSAAEIVERSRNATHASWSAFPQYAYNLREVSVNGGHETTTAYQVLMIDNSPYYVTTSINGAPVSSQEQDASLRSEIARRKSESPGQRERRIEKYQRERRQDQALLEEMLQAFDFHLKGDEAVEGRACYVLEATPRIDYHPKDRNTKVLTGMRGQMWIDQQAFQWVRVRAEVFRPVSFGLFIAQVHPGTEFLFEMKPVGQNLWLPSHFEIHVRASLLFWSRESREEDYYAEYRPAIDESTGSK